MRTGEKGEEHEKKVDRQKRLHEINSGRVWRAILSPVE
jgi:hypothetical protein